MTPGEMEQESREGAGDSPPLPPIAKVAPGPGGGMPSMWTIIGASLRDAWRLAGQEKATVALLLTLELLLGGVPLLAGKGAKESDLPFLTDMLAQLLALPFTLRFCAALLGIARADALPPAVWVRLAGWGAFCVVLGMLESVAALPVPLPRPVTAAIELGAIYFALRLLPLYPAIMSWPDWPGIDRLWAASRRFVMPLIGCAVAVYLPIFLVIILVLAATSVIGHGGDDPVLTTARLEHLLEPLLPVMTVLTALLATAATLFGAALRVRLFRLIA
ncbi:hypothetical protein [Acidomonas methanolica]|nr:hypothetical protein [Acidomonas methanolica]MBU2654353.1 hypothetical protein [Acidomonas methanolica]TCS28441.1 hypothetical protein EDC31_10829 [Acidomonas methanolica]GBQ56903.1 hypothetical protein AA0498_2448 [Acidomonas methanolica]